MVNRQNIGPLYCCRRGSGDKEGVQARLLIVILLFKLTACSDDCVLLVLSEVKSTEITGTGCIFIFFILLPSF